MAHLIGWGQCVARAAYDAAGYFEAATLVAVRTASYPYALGV
ncbi:hypothetical protein [Botrimarina mediterranea]|nr:hypothetical protein [Botrimarina mediterranea]